jgi:acetolactate synthase-1/2/3 large subunit
MRVADYIAWLLAEHGTNHVFLVTGGGAMHLNDAFGRADRFHKVFCHHEQACAMAAEGYPSGGRSLCGGRIPKLRPF